jgi:hypothetical protein
VFCFDSLVVGVVRRSFFWHADERRVLRSEHLGEAVVLDGSQVRMVWEVFGLLDKEMKLEVVGVNYPAFLAGGSFRPTPAVWLG